MFWNTFLWSSLWYIYFFFYAISVLIKLLKTFLLSICFEYMWPLICLFDHKVYIFCYHFSHSYYFFEVLKYTFFFVYCLRCFILSCWFYIWSNFERFFCFQCGLSYSLTRVFFIYVSIYYIIIYYHIINYHLTWLYSLSHILHALWLRRLHSPRKLHFIYSSAWSYGSVFSLHN